MNDDERKVRTAGKRSPFTHFLHLITCDVDVLSFTYLGHIPVVV